MARPDFDLVWGSDNAPFTPIEASDYTAGWVFRTGAPPRRVNFDYFQNLSDQRTAWLGEQMLLAVGHEWQDDVSYDAYAVVRSPVNGQLYRSLVAPNLNNEPSVSGAQWALGVADTADLLNTTRIDVASAGTVSLTTAAPDTRHINITGTTTINGFTVAAGQAYLVSFAAALTLVNSASLVTRRGANISVAAGDSCWIRATAANTVEIVCGDFLSDRGLGSGQTWQNLTGSRTAGTTYTNTSGRSIQIIVNANGTNSARVTILVNGTAIIQSAASEGAGNTENVSCSIPIPNLATYSFQVDLGGALSSVWELR
jgi:hypothetical protein